MVDLDLASADLADKINQRRQRTRDQKNSLYKRHIVLSYVLQLLLPAEIPAELLEQDDGYSLLQHVCRASNGI